MDTAGPRSYKHHLVVLILALLGSSCTPFDVSAPEDYIGPKSTEPNALAAEGHGVVESQPAVVEPPAQTGPLQITTEQAVLLALENNRSLVVERLNPRISRTFVSEELSVFDPILSGQLGYEWDQLTQGSTDVDQSGPLASVGVDEFLPTGTTFGVSGEVSPSEPGLFASTGDDYTSTLAFNATQSLLRGAGTAVNMASVNQAKIDVEISQYELRGFVQTLIAQVEETYWDYVLAERRIEIYSQSLDLAEKQLAETEERIKIGDLAKTESSAAEAEVALRREALINARSTLAKTKLSLLRLVNPPGTNLWDRQITLASLPTSLSVALDDVEPHVELAMRMRPDLNQAKLLWQRGDLEVVKTRNGLLPKLDLFVTLGRTGYSNSFGESATSSDDYGYGAMTGLSFEFPAGNRAARSSHLRAVLSRQQAKEAVGNLSQLIEVDVRTAYLEIVRSQEQVAATAVTRKFQEEKVRVEMEKFRLGKSTPLLVAQAQRDLVVSQIDETQAMVNYLKSFVEIYRLEGSLLERRGIAGPGQKPVEWSAEP